MEVKMNGTNANLTKLAAVLADATESTLSELVVQKKGAFRGRGSEKKVHGDDLVKVEIITGFSYRDILVRSLDDLDKVDPKDVVVAAADNALLNKEGLPITSKDALQAYEELRASFKASLEGNNKASTTRNHFTTLVVDGEKVPGTRVYNPEEGANENPRIERGTIYIQGLVKSEEVLRPAKNGPIPDPKSKGVSIAKRILRKQLPVGGYVSYQLAPGTPFILRLGGTIAVHSKKNGKVRFKDSSVEEVFSP
jgi:hypothetical protein